MDTPLTRAMALVQSFVRGSASLVRPLDVRASGDLEETLRGLVETATEAVGLDMAGLTIRDERSRPTTVVFTDEVVPVIDAAQYSSDRGPCVDATRPGDVQAMDDARTEQRWPEFATAAADHGLRSTLSIPVVAAGRGL